MIRAVVRLPARVAGLAALAAALASSAVDAADTPRKAPGYEWIGSPAPAEKPAEPAIDHDSTSYTYAVGGFAPEYEVPAPGSYELPPIDTIADHDVVAASGDATTLRKVTGGRLAVVSFIYASCGEVTGCPMSTELLRTLDRRISSDVALARDVALVTLSFDPARDTPGRLREMEKLRVPGSTWQFVTAKDEAALQPILDDFGQSVSKLRRADGTETGAYRHVLKVYLLDRDARVRNVYSVGFLHADLVLADLRTLELEAARAASK